MELYKHSNHRNSKYLSWLRNQRCVVSGKPAEVAHHIRLGTNGGKGLKPSDYFCIPLTEEHHTHGQGAVHRIGEETFLISHKVSLYHVIIKFLSLYIESMLNQDLIRKDLSELDQIALLIEKAESFNTTNSKKSIKKVKAKKLSDRPKVSITEDEYYQKAKEFKKQKDKELRDKLKLAKTLKNPSTNVKKISKKVTSRKIDKNSDEYLAAKELQRKRSKELREANKQKNSEYRKKMYKEAKERHKAYLKTKLASNKDKS